MNCHNCKKEMTMTPVCLDCGTIPVAQASFNAKDKRIRELEDALRTARSLIVEHHNCSKPVMLGQPCPHCVKEDGSEPEMNQIAKALREGERK